MRVLITGAAGFIGGYLARHAEGAGASVAGMDIAPAPESWRSGAFAQFDVRDPERLAALLAEFRPERIFHLAAQSYPTVSLAQPRETVDVNAGGTVNLFECLRAAGLAPMVVVACSSAEYGPVAAENLPVREEHPLRPLHPYGVSKVAQDLLAYQYFIQYGLPCVRIRIFNTTGPGKLGDVCSDLTKRAAAIESGAQAPALAVGNLGSRRAIIDVRDMVRALWLAAEQCEPGEVYNVGAGAIYSVAELIDQIRSLLAVDFRVEPERALMRDCDEPVIAGDTTKFQQRTGWQPEIPLEATLGDMLQWWRRRIGECAAA
jgi:GDP-4-dehydro-6-deoxy-D-mannose reductase